MRLLISFLLLIFLCQCASLSKDVTQNDENIPVVFTYMDDQAQKVCIAGSFNQWSTQSHCMKKDRNTWTLRLSLQPGRYTYLLLIDDRISKLDPGAPLTEENGFGTKNSILVVEKM
jgi:1,4-alpha-glucan branching enzyme